MFAVSVLYAIPDFEQLKTRLRVKVCAVLRCFTYFLRSSRSPYADNARNVRGISVIVCENVAAIAFVDDFPLTISRHMTHVSRLRESCVIHTQFTSDSALIMRGFPSRIRHAQPRIRPVWGLFVPMR